MFHVPVGIPLHGTQFRLPTAPCLIDVALTIRVSLADGGLKYGLARLEIGHVNGY